MTPPRLGLRENLPQFSLLVLLNAFAGAMVGLERTVLPLLGEQEFGLTSKTAITSFIVSFGYVAVGVTSWITGYLAAHYALGPSRSTRASPCRSSGSCWPPG